MKFKNTYLGKILNGFCILNIQDLTNIFCRNVNKASFKITKPYKLHKLQAGPASTATVTTDEALKMYSDMLTIREFETVAANLYQLKIVRGFLHLYAGQEAVAVGIHEVMRKHDSLITSYRCHGFCYLMGVSIAGVLGELAGRKTGCGRGKGGSMHMYAPKFYGGNGIVGGHVPLGAGIAFAHSYKSDGGVCFTVYGDGAANQGQVFEAMNLAKLWKLPCVFFCENNKFGLGTAAHRASASTEFYTRGDYVPGLCVDGMDVIACREAARYSIDHCTSGNGPIVVEAQTYRYYGHSMSDPGTSYRTPAEVKQVRQTSDPIKLFRERIVKSAIVTEEQLEEIKKKVRNAVEKVSVQVQSDPPVDLEELGADVYKSCVAPDKTNRDVLPNHPLKHFNRERS